MAARQETTGSEQTSTGSEIFIKYEEDLRKLGAEKAREKWDFFFETLEDAVREATYVAIRRNAETGAKDPFDDLFDEAFNNIISRDVALGERGKLIHEQLYYAQKRYRLSQITKDDLEAFAARFRQLNWKITAGVSFLVGRSDWPHFLQRHDFTTADDLAVEGQLIDYREYVGHHNRLKAMTSPSDTADWVGEFAEWAPALGKEPDWKTNADFVRNIVNVAWFMEEARTSQRELQRTTESIRSIEDGKEAIAAEILRRYLKGPAYDGKLVDVKLPFEKLKEAVSGGSAQVAAILKNPWKELRIGRGFWGSLKAVFAPAVSESMSRKMGELAGYLHGVATGTKGEISKLSKAHQDLVRHTEEQFKRINGLLSSKHILEEKEQDGESVYRLTKEAAIAGLMQLQREEQMLIAGGKFKDRLSDRERCHLEVRIQAVLPEGASLKLTPEEGSRITEHEARALQIYHYRVLMNRLAPEEKDHPGFKIDRLSSRMLVTYIRSVSDPEVAVTALDSALNEARLRPVSAAYGVGRRSVAPI